jgi:hypothetical protein
MTTQQPSIGRIVHYQLSDTDVAMIDRQLHEAAAGVHRNSVHAGDVYPAMVVRVFDLSVSTSNLQVFLDGDCSYWATSRVEGDQPGTWTWPARV